MLKISRYLNYWNCLIKKYYIFHIFLLLTFFYVFKHWRIPLIQILIFIFFPFFVYFYKNLKYRKLINIEVNTDKLILTSRQFFYEKTTIINLDSLETIYSNSCEQVLGFVSENEIVNMLITNANKKEIIARLLKLDCSFYYELPEVVFINSIETVDETVKLHTSNQSIIGARKSTVQFGFNEIRAIHLSKPYLFKESKGKALIYVRENEAHIFKFYKGKDNKIYNGLIALKKELGIYYG